MPPCTIRRGTACGRPADRATGLHADGAEAIQRALCPGHGQPQAFLGSSPVGGVFGALVEGHGDVGAKGDLHVHGVLGGEKWLLPVQVRAETDALVGDLAELAEREDLKAAGIREQARGQLMNLCRPPMRRMGSWPGRR